MKPVFTVYEKVLKASDIVWFLRRQWSHMESRLRVPVQMESRLSVPVQDGVQTLKSTGIAIDTRRTWSIPGEETTWIDSVLLRRTQQVICIKQNSSKMPIYYSKPASR